MVITSDGYRGNKTIALKEIIDALEKCTSIEKVLLKEQTPDNDERGQRYLLQPLLDGASDNSVAEIMDSEDPLFILYTRFDRKTERNGSHHRWLYGLYRLYFKKCFQL
jgi:acetyl-CoA synthetase